MESYCEDEYKFQTSLEKQHSSTFLKSLHKESISHLAVNHPYLKALSNGEFFDHEHSLKEFAIQYQIYQENFIRYLTTVISKLDNPEHRSILIQNLIEESGCLSKDEIKTLKSYGIKENWVQGVTHTELFKRFMKALNVDKIKLDYHKQLDVLCWRETFNSILLNGSAAEAIGALSFGTENIVSGVYQHFVKAIKHYGKIKRKDSVFFDLHTLVDDHHQESLSSIAAFYAQTETGRIDLHKGMHKALSLRVSFWDAMYQKNTIYAENTICA